MKSSSPRFVELQGLSEEGPALQLVGRITLGAQVFPFVLDVDPETYHQLHANIIFNNKYRYRLSLNSTWNPFRQKYCCSITKIGLDDREEFYFDCSERFFNMVNQLRNIRTSQELLLIQDLKLNNQRNDNSLTAAGIYLAATEAVMGEEEAKRPSVEKNPAGGYDHADVLAKTASGFNVFKLMYIPGAIFLTVLLIVLVIARVSDRHVVTSDLNGAFPASNILDDLPEEREVLSKSDGIVNFADDLHASKKHNFPAWVVDQPINYSVPPGYVALTFDDGPTKYTREIVDILAEQQVGATFFLIGKKVATDPDAVKYIVEHGMSVGSHSYSHINLAKVTIEQLAEEIVRSKELIESITASPITLIRPPYGSLHSQLASTVQTNNMKVMLWNRDPQDWKVKSSREILQYFYDTNPSGGVYLLHENKHTVEELPEIIKYLKEHEVEFVILR